MKARLRALAALVSAAVACSLWAQQPPAVVANVKVLSEKVDDASSLESLAKSVLKDGMTGEQKAIALFGAVVRLRHHDRDAREYLSLNGDICGDAVAIFNGYGYCSGRGSHIAFRQLARAAGIPARAVSVNRWGTTELFYDDSWHCLDPGMIFYFRKPGGAIASVDEIVAGVKPWYEAHPGYLGNDPKIREFLRTEGVAKGPDILRNCPTMDEKGNFPLNFFAWYTAMLIFDGSNRTPFLYEEPSVRGDRVNILLHRGETFIRRWSSDGRCLDSDDPKLKPDCLGMEVGKKALYYTPKLSDLANGRIGCGRIAYNAPLDGSLLDPAKPGVYVLRRQCGYVYLGGQLTLKAALMAAPGGSVTVEFSDTNGLSWKEIARLTEPGEAKVDLTPHILRRYGYILRVTPAGAGTRLEKLALAEDIQCSQRALPALDKGDNRVTFTAGPEEATVTLPLTGLKWKGKQPTYEDMGVRVEKMNADVAAKYGTLSSGAADATVTFPVETPGDMVRLRLDASYRAIAGDEAWEIEASFDEGKTWKPMGRATGPTRQENKNVAFTDIPGGARKALVRLRGTQKNSLVLFDCRLDADYRPAGAGFAPVRITYSWAENGKEQKDIHVVKSSPETYSIRCDEKPVMTSITLERAD